MTKVVNRHLVAVYGSLLKGLHNHKHYLSNAKLLGSFDSIPEYNLYDLGSFPGLKKGGHTSIKMEVYEVTTLELNHIDRLEGFKPNDKENNHYNRTTIETPYGKAYGYMYNRPSTHLTNVTSGNWKDYVETKNIAHV